MRQVDHTLACLRRGAERGHALITSAIKASAAPTTLSLALVGCLSAATDTRAADAAFPSKAPPVKIYSTILFSGVDARERSYYGYAGAIHAFNGNLATDGFMLRALGYYNPYNYDSTAVVGGKVDGRLTAFDVMVGYQKYFQGYVGRLYVGYDYEHHRLSPDNLLDSNRGTGSGVKVRGELETLYDSPYYGSLLASYGSARHRYWVRGRTGYNFQGVILGPEGVVTGNPETKEQRIGGFATFRNPTLAPFEVSISSGYSNTKASRGGPSVYGMLEFSVAF